MYALVAALIAITVIAVMWRYLEREADSSDAQRRDHPRPAMPALPRLHRRSRTIAPDDDPEFLRELNKRINKNPNEGPRSDTE